MAVTHPVILRCRNTARRLLLHRALESVAVTVALVGPLAVWLTVMQALAARGQSGWALAGIQLWAVWVAGVVHPRMRAAARAGPMQTVFTIIAGTALYAATTTAILTGDQPPLWWRAGGIVAVGAAVGPLPALLKGVSVRQAAVWLDRQLGTKDRIATAVEKLQTDAPLTDETELIVTQADRSAEAGSPPGRAYWRRTRVTAALTGLALAVSVLAGVLAGPPESDEFTTRLALVADRLERAQRREIATAMRNAARSADPDKARLLREAAIVMVDAEDRDRLAKLLEELRRRGYDVREDVPRQVLEALAKMGGDGDAASATGTDDDRSRTDIETDPNESDGPGRLVFSPTAGEDNPTDANAATRAIRPEPLPWEQAWSRARQRAADALTGGRVPPRYRELIERYYERPQGD
jgi:hypothetical protein